MKWKEIFLDLRQIIIIKANGLNYENFLFDRFGESNSCQHGSAGVQSGSFTTAPSDTQSIIRLTFVVILVNRSPDPLDFV